uniref:Uncharacterized protein n=1 Tax=Cyprinus carpio TaxID=7962 RepID=A0A8C1JK84_CYPCA
MARSRHWTPPRERPWTRAPPRERPWTRVLPRERPRVRAPPRERPRARAPPRQRPWTRHRAPPRPPEQHRPGNGQNPGNQSRNKKHKQHPRNTKNQGDIQQGLRNKDRNKPGIYRQVITILTGNWLSAMINDQGQLSAMSSDETDKTKGNVVLRWGDAKGK